MPVSLIVAEGQKVLQDGQVYEEGERFEAGDQNAESLIERGLAEKPKAGRPPKAASSSDDE